MAISLNSINSRVTSLESKVGAGGGIIESKLANPGYVKFANGLIINFGSVSSSGVGFVAITFAKAFPNAVIGACASMVRNSGAGSYRSIGALSNTSISVCKDGSSRSLFIAIGY